MSNAQMYVWFIMGGFLVMTTLFILAERENKKLRSAIKENNEDERFNTVYRQIETEVQTLNQKMDDEFRTVHQEISGIWNSMPTRGSKTK